MDYAEAREAFFQPREGEFAPPGLDDTGTPGRRLRDAMEPIATICFWSEPAYEHYEAVGLDFLGGYVWGRASVLGEPDASVAAAAFGVFEPGLVASVYDAAREACSLADVRGAKQRGAVVALEQTMGRPEDLDEVVEVLRRGTSVAATAGRAMSAGLAGMDWPEDALAQLWHACSLLREHRGDGHLAVCVAAGLDGVQANILTELAVGWQPLAYTASRGWPEDAMAAGMASLEDRGLVADGELTDAGREMRADIEDQTDALVAPVLDAIGDDLEPTIEALGGWADAVVDHGWFPPDPYKRASG